MIRKGLSNLCKIKDNKNKVIIPEYTSWFIPLELFYNEGLLKISVEEATKLD